MVTKLLNGLGGFGAILFLLGVGLSVVAAFMGSLPFTATILGIVGLVVGFLNITSKESLTFLTSVIAVSLLTGILAALPTVGGTVEAILVNIAVFAGAAALVVALKEIFRVASK